MFLLKRLYYKFFYKESSRIIISPKLCSSGYFYPTSAFIKMTIRLYIVLFYSYFDVFQVLQELL